MTELSRQWLGGWAAGLTRLNLGFCGGVDDAVIPLLGIAAPR